MSLRWLLRRLGLVAYTMLVVSVIVFGITQLLPADAATTLLGENATPEALAAVRERLGLDQSAAAQYAHWLGHVLSGDFGTSMRTGQAVGPVLMLALGRSLVLAAFALVLVVILAVPLGVVAALRRGGAVDLGAGLLSYLGVSLPEFVTGTLLLMLLADWLGWLPATGYVPLSEDPVDGLLHLVLPVLTVALVLMAHISRMVRSETIDVLHSDYVRAARLKGLPPSRVVLGHALRNALLPVVTVLALDVGYLLGGIIVVEEIFAIPGIGRALITAISARDLPTVQAGALIMAATYSLANLGADVVVALLDPRIRYD